MDNISLASGLVKVREGWYSAPELSWIMTGPDPEDYVLRGIAKATLSELYQRNAVERLIARHNKTDLILYYIDPEKIRAALEGWSR